MPNNSYFNINLYIKQFKQTNQIRMDIYFVSLSSNIKPDTLNQIKVNLFYAILSTTVWLQNVKVTFFF